MTQCTHMDALEQDVKAAIEKHGLERTTPMGMMGTLVLYCPQCDADGEV